MGNEDEKHIHLSGRWVGHDPEGIGEATLHHEGHRITGHGKGGAVHPTLTHKFELEGEGRRYAGKYTNEEGVARGQGRMEIEVVDPRTISCHGTATGPAEGVVAIRKAGRECIANNVRNS